MILLDTRVILESQRAVPDARVLQWMDAQALETLYLCAITVAELRSGIAQMPAGRRQEDLRENLEKRLLPMFANRVLPFDMACTHAYAELIGTTHAAGVTPPGATVTFVAAVALANGFSIATIPYESAGVMVISPWEART